MWYNPKITSFIFGTVIILVYGYFSLFSSSFLSVLILLSYVSYHLYNSKSDYRNIIQTSLKSIFIASTLAFIVFSYKSYGPRDWDFTCFYLYGNVAASGLNFYNPVDYYSILETLYIPIELNAGFIREVVDVGCPYPPPTLILFSVLGFFSYSNALVLWTILNNIFLIGSIFLIRNIFFNNKGAESILIATILVLTFHSTLTTVFYSQILFILLFFLLLFYKYRSTPWCGVFLAIAIFLKPFAIVLFLYLIIIKQKRAIYIFFLSCIAICLITIFLFGFQPFIEYFLNNPNKRAPELLFTEFNNQSLLAELFRYLPDNTLLAKIIYYIISVSIVVLFSYIFYQNRKSTGIFDIYFVILLSVMLLIYPSGQYNYPLVHLVSVLILLNYFRRLDSSAFFLSIFYLVSYAGLFYLNIFLLFISLLIIYKKRYDQLFSEMRNSIKSGT